MISPLSPSIFIKIFIFFYSLKSDNFMTTVYVDTSVFGGYFEKQFSESSIQLLNEFKKGHKNMMISEVVINELKDAKERIKQLPFHVPVHFLTIARTSVKALKLAALYIAEGVLTNNSYNDAMHIATATLQSADVLASWNFKHMANSGRIEKYNIINQNMGYRQIKILTPREILKP
jgi:predicted nucleic acid-binding protein